MKRIRVLVVEDSLTVRHRLVSAIERDPAFEVIGEAGDGHTAIALCEKLRPDVITLDMVLPELDGLAVTEHIMAFCPTPIVIVSSSINRGEVMNTLDALAAGAVDVLDKPGTSMSDTEWNEKLLDVLKLASRIRVITHPRARLRSATDRAHTAHLERRGERSGETPARKPSSPVRVPTPLEGLVAPRATEGRYRLVAIGASTGGPGAVTEILSALPKDFPLPILVVIHISKPFGTIFSEWLADHLSFPVYQAIDGEPLSRPGPSRARVILAPPDRHLVIAGGRTRLSHAPERHSCRPSVDVLFESIAVEIGPAAIGCLLTGMGRDGAEGLLAMHKAGAATLAQDEASSVIFGMPQEAIRLGATDRVLHLSAFAGVLTELAAASAIRREKTL